MITRLKMSNLADLKTIVLVKTVATNDKIDDLINTINDLEDRIKELENKYFIRTKN